MCVGILIFVFIQQNTTVVVFFQIAPYVDIPIRLPPALCVSRSVCVCEKVLLFGFENKK